MELEFNEKLSFLFKPATQCSSGIYCILNLINGKVYIGSAINVKSRWRQHKSELALSKHANRHLQQSYNKYGVAAFEFLVLEHVTWKSDLIKREDCWIHLTNCCDPLCGYNICKKANSSLGVIRSKATRLKISKGNSGVKRTLEFKNNLSKLITGRKHSPSAIANMIEAQKKNDKRKLDKWPHIDGIKCKCIECNEKKRIYTANRRAIIKNGH